MKSEKVKLESVCKRVVSGGTPKSTVSDYYNGSIPWLNTKEVHFNRIYSTEKTISDDGLKNSSAKWIPSHCVIIAMYGATAGNVAINMLPLTTNQACCNLELDEEKADFRYIYYYLKYKYMDMSLLANGGAQQNLNAKIIKDFPISLPELKVQRKIASMLWSLDDKIAINNKINKNLEQQVQTIYNYMFVANGDPTWKRGCLKDLITVKYGKDHKKLSDGLYPVYGSGGIMRYVERPLYEKESVLIPRKGTLNNVIYVNQPFWSVDTMFYTEMKVPNVAKFVYQFVKSKDLASMNAGSAVPSMTTDILNAMEIVVPPAEILEKFEAIVAPMYQMMQKNNEQSATLATLRDSLLPKLMAGEICNL